MKINLITFVFCACITFPTLGEFANNNVKARIHVYDERKNSGTSAVVKLYKKRPHCQSGEIGLS